MRNRPDRGRRYQRLVESVKVQLDRSITIDVADTVTRSRITSPHLTLLIGFTAMTLVTAILLSLPMAAASGRATSFHDALFTATSAVNTVGLVVVDTGTHWSQFGRIVILIAMEVGGLGFMAGTIVLFQAVGRQISRHYRQTLQEQLSLQFFGGISRTAQVFIAYTLVIELLGALLLTWQFARSDGPGAEDPLFYGIFHSVSAFTGSGFDLMGGFSSMSSMASEPLFLLTMMALIVPGDLGFLAVIDLAYSARWPRSVIWRLQIAAHSLLGPLRAIHWVALLSLDWIRSLWGKSPPMRLHRRVKSSARPSTPSQVRMETKLIMAVNLICWPLAALGFLVLDWNNPDTLGAMRGFDRVLNAFFISVCSRNAGFSTVDMSAVSDVALIFLVPFMVIGAASASMGAGMKVNTVGVVFATARSRLLGRRRTEIFGRSVPYDRVYVAVTLVVLFLVLEFITLLVVHGAWRNASLINSLFDAASAVSDIGFSTGVPSQLNVGGKLFMCAVMLIARLGPLTVVLALLRPRRIDAGVRYPEESLRVG